MAAAKSYDKKKSSSSSGGGDYNKKRKFNNNNNSQQTPSNKKRALKAERQSHRKHASTVLQSKEIWNELRKKSNDKETISKLATELHTTLKGKCMEVTMQHDASRCVQGVLQFGNEMQRREVVMELCEAGSGSGDKSSGEKKNQTINLAELCKIQYAHFVVLKMIKYCFRDDVCVKLIVKVSLLVLLLYYFCLIFSSVIM